MDELIRDAMHEALDIELPAGLRSRVISAVPMTGRAAWRTQRWVFEWSTGLVAVLLVVAIVVGLLYSRGALNSQVNVSPVPVPPRFSSPEGVVVGPDGTVYFSDYVSGDVFRVRPDGSIVAVAGAGTGGSGGPAITTQLNHPAGLAFDAGGNLYIAEYAGRAMGNNLPTGIYQGTVRRIGPNGNMTTLAGSGHSTEDGVQATSGLLNTPLGLAFDKSGSLYVGDQWSDTVRIVDKRGIIHTLNTSNLSRAGYWQPGYLAFDSAGNLYVSDGWVCRIVRFSPSGAVSVVAGTGTCGFNGGDGGPATSAQLNYPGGIAFDSRGNLYFSDSGNHRVRRIDQRGIITTVAGRGSMGSSGDGGPATNAQLAYPDGLAMAPGDLLYIAENYISDSGTEPTTSGRIRLLQISSGVITTIVSSQSPIRSSG